MKTLILLFTLLLNFSSNDKIPQEVANIAKQGNKVYIQAYDNNAVVHATNAIESWWYWNVGENKHQADFILKIYLRFEGAGVCITNATFVDPKTNNVIYSTKEVTSIKEAKGFDFNTKRSAMRQLVEKVFKPNFK